MYAVRDISVEKSVNDSATQFSEVTMQAFGPEGGNIQKDSIALTEEFAARHLRLVIKSGYDNFCALFRISVTGSANLFSTKVDTNFGSAASTVEDSPKFKFGSAFTPSNTGSPSPPAVAGGAPGTSPKANRKKSSKKPRAPEAMQAYSFNNTPPNELADDGDAVNPDETEEAGFQSTFRLPQERTSFAKRTIEEAQEEENGVGAENNGGVVETDDVDDDDDAQWGPGVSQFQIH